MMTMMLTWDYKGSSVTFSSVFPSPSSRLNNPSIASPHCKRTPSHRPYALPLQKRKIGKDKEEKHPPASRQHLPKQQIEQQPTSPRPIHLMS